MTSKNNPDCLQCDLAYQYCYQYHNMTDIYRSTYYAVLSLLILILVVLFIRSQRTKNKIRERKPAV